MAEFLEQMRIWVEQVILTLGYFGIALVMFIENIFPPIPSEVVMPFAGSLVAKGELTFSGVLISGTIGAVVGATAIYYLGVWLEASKIRTWFGKYGRFLLMSEADFDQAMATFDKNGKKMVLAGRVIPTIRSLISLPAGLEEMRVPTFLLYTSLGTVVWNIILAYGGFLLGQNWEAILAWVRRYETAIWVGLAILTVYFVYRRLRN
jgi:membrane protein DedA with SNARE-associated domain